MQILRTPDERFTDLPGYPFAPHYAEVDAGDDPPLRMLCAFSDSDPITAGADRVLRKLIPGAAGQAHTTIAGAGHFLQEDRGPELASVVAAFITETM